MTLLSCKDLSVGYGINIVASNIDFHVCADDYLCIVGENGAGKTTLMKTLLGFIPPIDGTISFDNGFRKNCIGYLPQQTDIQREFPASVEEIVLSGCVGRMGLSPFYNSASKVIARENMERMRIAEFAKRSFRELSGGQQQRVLLARALCATDRMLLLDEPVAGLDPNMTEEMYAIVKELNENGTSIIMISHDLDAAILYASHILRISSSSPFFGTTREYLEYAEGR